MTKTMINYRVLPVQVPVHGLLEHGVLSEPKGFELLKQNGIRLVSLGMFPTEEAAKAVARKNALPDEANFV